MSLPDLADECVVMEHECHLDDIPAETVKRMYMSLYHRHIPSLVEDGVVEYDQEHDLVTARPVLSEVQSQLDLTRGSLSSRVKHALETLRGEIDTAEDGDCSADGVTIAHTRKTLESAGYDEEAVGCIVGRLERTGYIQFVGDCVRIVE